MVLLLFALFHSPVGAADHSPALAWDSQNNRHLLVYVQQDIGLSPRVYGKWLGCDGSAQGAAFLISDADSMEKRAPFVVFDSVNRRFLIVWEDNHSGLSFDVYARLLDSSGTLGDEIVVSSADRSQRKPKVAFDTANEAYLVVWQDDRSANDVDLYGQRIAADGTIRGLNFPVAEAGGNQANPAVVFDAANRRFLVVWEDSRSGESDLYARHLNADGTPDGSDFVVSSAGDDQIAPCAAYHPRQANVLVAFQTRRLEADVELSVIQTALVGPPCQEGGNGDGASDPGGQGSSGGGGGGGCFITAAGSENVAPRRRGMP